MTFQGCRDLPGAVSAGDQYRVWASIDAPLERDDLLPFCRHPLTHLKEVELPKTNEFRIVFEISGASAAAEPVDPELEEVTEKLNGMMTELRLPRGVRRGEWPTGEAIYYLVLKGRLNQKIDKCEGTLVPEEEQKKM